MAEDDDDGGEGKLPRVDHGPLKEGDVGKIHYLIIILFNINLSTNTKSVLAVTSCSINLVVLSPGLKICSL